MAEKAKRRTLDEQIDAALKEREKKDERIKDLLTRRSVPSEKQLQFKQKSGIMFPKRHGGTKNATL